METYLQTLEELGYDGPLTIEREIAHDREPAKDRHRHGREPAGSVARPRAGVNG